MYTFSFLKKHSAIMFISLLISGTVASAHAGADATEPTQLLNHAELIPTALATGATQVSTHGLWMREFVLDPAANVGIELLIQGVAKSVQNWVNSGLSGTYPLIAQDPQKYLQNVGMDSARISLAKLPEDNYFSGSIFDALRNNAMWKYSTNEEKLASLTKSNTPYLIQQNTCSDEALTAAAESLAIDDNGTINQETLQNQKEILYDYICEGNPEDPEMAARLKDYAQQNPEAMGWEGFLNITGGDNDYSNSVKAVNADNEEQETKQLLEIKDLYDGQNPLSERECVRWGTDLNGNQVCEETVTTTPSDTVSDSLSKSATVELERLFNMDGAGSFASILSGFTTQALLNGITRNFSAQSGSGGGSSSNSQSTTNSFSPDLSGASQTKNSIVSPVIKSLDDYNEALDELQSIDNEYRGVANSYQGRVETVKSCFDDLVSKNKLSESSSSYQRMKEFYTDRMSKINDVVEIINQDEADISQTRAYTGSLKSQITTSNSSEEITSLFMEFQQKQTDGTIPNFETFAKRRSDLVVNKQRTSADNEPNSLMYECRQIENDYNRA